MDDEQSTSTTGDPGLGAAPGRALRHTLRGHHGWINRIAWSPDGTKIASASNDHTVRVWDAATGQLLQTFEGHDLVAICLAWSPDGERIISGSYDLTVRLWNLKTGRAESIFRGPSDCIHGVAWSPDGQTIAAAACDKLVHRWDVETGVQLGALGGHTEGLFSLAWSSTGDLASGASDNIVRVWKGAESEHHTVLRGHGGYVLSLAWSPDGTILASGSTDSTIRLWDVASARNVNTLEGHTGHVRSLSFSADGRLLASKAADGTVRLWRSDTWDTVAIIPEDFTDAWLAGIDFHPTQPALATLGEGDMAIRIWDLDAGVLLGGEAVVRAVRYTTAKIVLVGDSGVGKTSLGWRLAYGEFREHPSTHGQQFWVLGDLRRERADGAECEAVLWDLAGQPDYRLTNALFLDDADLALLLFDPTNRQQPLQGVDYWLKALPRREGRLCRTILVGARADRGEATLTRDAIEAFARDRGITGGYISTSGLSGQGLTELYDRIQDQVVWDEIPATVTTETFKRIKDLLLMLKQEGHRDGLLPNLTGLRMLLERLDPGWSFSDEELRVAIGHLAKHGYVKVLSTASEEHSVLLAPELLNNLAASFVIEARRNPQGLGALEEDRVLNGQYAFPELATLSPREREIMLESATRLFLEHNICFRKFHNSMRLLIFPQLINVRVPRLSIEGPTDEGHSYHVVGAVENVYAMLVTLLGYTNVLRRRDQWQNQAEYEVQAGEICGFRQESHREGEIDLVIYFGTGTRPHTRMLFQGLLEQFLESPDLHITPYPPIVCDACGYRQERTVVARRVERGDRLLHCSDCGQPNELPDRSETLLSGAQQHLVASQSQTADLRTKFESALVTVKRFAAQRLPRTQAAARSCFISYAHGEDTHERWVRDTFAVDLRNAGIDVIIDYWDNARAGASIDRFIADEVTSADVVIVVGTPLYLAKCDGLDQSDGHVLAEEFETISPRLRIAERGRETVHPILLAGDPATSLPVLVRDKVRVDFRKEEQYFASLFDLILTVYDIPHDDLTILELRKSLR